MYFVAFQIVRDSKDRVFTWGFGGYGRLGHQQPKDEHVPRLVAFFKSKSENKLVFFYYFALSVIVIGLVRPLWFLSTLAKYYFTVFICLKATKTSRKTNRISRHSSFKDPATHTQHFNAASCNIVARNVLHAFGHPVACC